MMASYVTLREDSWDDLMQGINIITDEYGVRLRIINFQETPGQFIAFVELLP